MQFREMVSRLQEVAPFVIDAAIIQNIGKIAHSTSGWDVSRDLKDLLTKWRSKNRGQVQVTGISFEIRLCTKERIIATSTTGNGHLVGIHLGEMIFLAHLESDGLIFLVVSEMSRLLWGSDTTSSREGLPEEKNRSQNTEGTQSSLESPLPTQKNLQDHHEFKPGVAFTARLMAHYRALEMEQENPLIVDPFARRLAGDLESYLENHVRFSEMDYPLIRSRYIEEKWLRPWTQQWDDSQIILLGAGLDSRAYRFKALQQGSHTIIEIDLPEIIEYKQEILSNETPLCQLFRLSLDFSKPSWFEALDVVGFSTQVPTFWILEGLVYYLPEETAWSLIHQLAKISSHDSEIFVDIMQQSRWLPYLGSSAGGGPFASHLKWGMDIKTVPEMFKGRGWNVECSFAEEHDRGRNAGQKNMIFVHGTRLPKFFKD